ICSFFEALFPDPNLMGATPAEKGLIEMWDRRVEFMMMVQFATWFRNIHPAMAPLEKPQVPEVAAKAEKGVKKFASRVDQHLEANEWLAANRFTIADITLFLTCGFCGVMKWKPQEEFGRIGRHFAAVKERLG
ncbi:MAG: glutathione binding-like protein, partial [Pseudomonadota bacterium]